MNCGAMELEPMKLPTFDGKDVNWWSFKDDFGCLIHQRKDLGDSEKLAYLRQCVSSKTVRLMEGAFDYKETWLELTRRYDRPDRHMEIYVQQFMALPIRPTETRENVMEVVDVVLTMLRVMRRHGHDPESMSPVLCPLVLEKLPAATVVHWKRKYSAVKTASVTSMMVDLEFYCETMCMDVETVSEPDPQICAVNIVRKSSTKPNRTGGAVVPAAVGKVKTRNLSARSSCGTRSLAKSNLTREIMAPKGDDER